jgi:Acetyltransferase (GNAT) family
MEDETAIRTMVSDDSVGLCDCIRRCYGNAYANRLMYEPTVLAEQLSSRAYRGVVAVRGTDIVGHIGYNFPTPSATVVEAGTTVVDPAYRGAGLLSQLAQALRENIIADRAVGFLHYPTTAHTVMQKASLKSGGCETGIMLAYLPPEARDLAIGGSGGDRLAVTVVYQPLSKATARALFLPDRYGGLIMDFAKSLQLCRTSAGDHATPTGATTLRQVTDRHCRRDRFIVDRIGDDLVERIMAAIEVSDAGVSQVDLSMDQPEVHHAVEHLRKLGFAFCAWLPGWNESDVLRLQFLKGPATGELHPNLHSPAAGQLAALIISELQGSIN